MAIHGEELRFKEGKREHAILLHSISHVNVVDNQRCEFAFLSRSGLFTVRAVDASTMAAWVAVLQNDRRA